MKTIKLAPGERLVTNQLNRKGVLPQNIVDAARDIVANVRANGDAAVRDYCQRFDGVKLQSFRLPQEQIDAALEGLDPAFVAALEKAARQIREFHQREVEQSWFTTRPDGTMLGVKVTPLAAAGIYVPGGRAQYPSTVLMNAIPAKVAGVKRVVMVTPPQKDGLISPYTLAAAKLGGVDEIYMVGGAQAVAALAYGTETIPRVDKITGPGNIFVATAKSLVSAFVGIDAVAGPTEIGIIADETANPSLLAADLIGQAEHDELAGSVLFTDSTEIADKVQESLKYRVPRTEHAERVHTSLSGTQSAIVLTDGLDQSIDAANAYAAEHLEIQTKDADAVVKRIKNAGAIFRGPYSPVPLGDYMSGSNHVLPTGGTARFAAGLGVHTFMKPVEVIEYDEEGLKALAARINAFAVSEDLPAHGECVLSRFVKDPYDKATLREQEKEAGLR